MDKEIQKLSPRLFDDTNYIEDVCLVMYNLLHPLARVRLSKHYTTKPISMYRLLRIQGKLRNLTDIYCVRTKDAG